MEEGSRGGKDGGGEYGYEKIPNCGGKQGKGGRGEENGKVVKKKKKKKKMMMVEGEGEGEVEEGGQVEGGVGNGRGGETSHGYWKNS